MLNFQDILVENQEKDRNCSVKNRAWDGWIRRKINTIQPYIEFLAKLKRTQGAPDIPTSKDNIICKDIERKGAWFVWYAVRTSTRLKNKTYVEM